MNGIPKDYSDAFLESFKRWSHQWLYTSQVKCKGLGSDSAIRSYRAKFPELAGGYEQLRHSNQRTGKTGL